MISIRDMKIAEDNSKQHGVSKGMLMTKAGQAFVKELKKKYSIKGKNIMVASYHGNNGGDGFVIAKLLSRTSKVTLLFIGDEANFSKETKENYQGLPASVRIVHALKEIGKEKFHYIIDALLGTGGEGKLRYPIKSVVDYMNDSKAKVISVDVPTGTNPETGEKSKPFVKPNLTITFHDKKPGLTGKISIVPIGIPPQALTQTGKGDVKSSIPPRPKVAKKGQFGKILVIGGSEDFAGAPALAVMALSAMRGGADLVRVLAPSRVSWAINSFTPDVITEKLEGDHINPSHVKRIEKAMAWADVILLGPGLGRHEETEEALAEILKSEKLKVVDADALKITNFSSLSNAILTPHRGEFEYLWANEFGTMCNFDESGMLKTAQLKKVQLALGSNIVLLKGPTDQIISQDYYKLNYTGDEGMTVGGTGDVLAGLTAGILAQSKDLFISATAGAWLSGKAGELCHEEMHYSYLASDLVKKIPIIIRDVLRE